VQPTGYRLVPDGLIRPVAVMFVLSALIATGLGLLFAGQRVGSSFDQSVYWLVYKQFVGERELLRVMLVPTEPVLLIVLISLVVMLAIARRRPRLAILAVAGPLIAVSLNSVVLKPVFGRTISNGSLAYPSGHTTGLVAVLTVLTLAVVAGVRPPWRKSLTTLVIVGGLVVAVVAATALIGMKYHYVTDTIGGAGTAVATVLAVAFGIDWIAARRQQPTAQRKQPATSGVAL
jgi:membrane-associated phospholipid phosphatase